MFPLKWLETLSVILVKPLSFKPFKPMSSTSPNHCSFNGSNHCFFKGSNHCSSKRSNHYSSDGSNHCSSNGSNHCPSDSPNHYSTDGFNHCSSNSSNHFVDYNLFMPFITLSFTSDILLFHRVAMDDDVHTSISIDSPSRNTNALSIVNSNDTSPPPPIPYVGQIFPDLESDRQFYYCYVGYAGFDVRRYSSKLIDPVIQSKKFVCSKQGESMKKANTDLVECHKINRKSHNVRESCKTFKIDTDGINWRVHIFVEHHTHELVTPRKRHFLCVNRHMSSTSRGLLDSLNSAHIQPSQQYSYAAMDSGGFSNLSYT
ncbi:hypothetical protein ZOSMA_118G00080 [Zostera marina]|uniref:FAR1 domain-containing protein n=1 Tax=Zostera marina TaxID=29655 RepID=A0A0K9Q1I0_ZOSMR|nr:hypothetical protein ZOSMA_118G00080 [Zostera marina]